MGQEWLRIATEMGEKKMKSRFLFIGLLVLGLSASSHGSDAEIDACASASDKMICVAKIFNRKLDLLTSAIQVVSMTYYDEANCTVPWATVSLAKASAANVGAVDSVCRNMAEQVKNVSSTNGAIESVLVGNGECVRVDIQRANSAAVIADCEKRLRAL